MFNLQFIKLLNETCLVFQNELFEKKYIKEVLGSKVSIFAIIIVINFSLIYLHYTWNKYENEFKNNIYLYYIPKSILKQIILINYF